MKRYTIEKLVADPQSPNEVCGAVEVMETDFSILALITGKTEDEVRADLNLNEFVTWNNDKSDFFIIPA